MGSIERLFRAQADPRLPDDERADVNAQALRMFNRSLSSKDFIPPDEIADAISGITADEQEFKKAVVLNSTWHDLAIPQSAGHKTILRVNNLGLVGAGPMERWAEKPFYGGLEFLKFAALQLDIFQAAILTRVRKSLPHFRRFRDNDQNPLGYEWIRKDDQKLTDDDREEIEYLDQVLQNSGTEFDQAKRKWEKKRPSLTEFITALIADTMTADACPIETELAADGSVCGWYNVAFDTIRLAHDMGFDGHEKVVAIQVVARQPITGLLKDEIVYETRNPRTALENSGYGQAELEHFLRLGTSYLNTVIFNAASLDRNSLPRGFLTLYGRYDKRSLGFFKTQWNAFLKGAAKRWGMPVLVSETKEGGAQWTPVDTTNQEMLMSKWLVYTASILGGLLGMDPNEFLNVESFSTKGGGLGRSDDVESRVAASNDKGHIPFTLWLFHVTNLLIGRFTNKYMITPVGLFPDNEKERHERLLATQSVDEVRAIDGQDPHPDPDIGNAPLNKDLMPIYTQKLGMRMQQQQAAAGGAGDEESLPGGEKPLPYAAAGAPKPNGNGAGGMGDNPFPAKNAANPAGGAPPFAKAKLRVEIRDLRSRLDGTT